MMVQRQTDLDLQSQENTYIKQSVLTLSKQGEIPADDSPLDDTMCRLARPHFNFAQHGLSSHVPRLLSETILKIVLNHQRNKEIRRTYAHATKGQHLGSELMRYIP